MGFKYSFRPAGSGDWGTVLKMIDELVKPEAYTTVKKKDLEAYCSGEHPLVHCILVEAVDDEETNNDNLKRLPLIVGFALYYYAFCCTAGKIVYLENLYLREGHRGNGLGKRLMSTVAKIGVENGCKAMQWVVLTSNEAARGFYEHIKASDMTETEGWNINRLEGENLAKLVNTV